MVAPTRAFVSLSLSLALGAAGCADKGEGDAKGEGEAAPVQGEDPKGEGEGETKTTPETTKPPVTSSADKAALTAVVQEMAETHAAYPVELAPLLDLVPADPTEYAVVRDVSGLLSLGEASLLAMAPALRDVADAAEAGGEADVKTKMEQVLTGFSTVTTSLRAAPFDLDKGVVIVDMGEDTAVVYGSSTPDALPKLLASTGVSGDDLPDACRALTEAPGYSICAAEEATLTAYAPGRNGAALRTTLDGFLSADEIEQGNVVAQLGDEPHERGAITVATPPGLLHLAVSMPKRDDSMSKLWGTGPATALGLVPPGSAFSWAMLDAAAIGSSSGEVPFPLKTTMKSLTGEALMGQLSDPSAFMVLVGVSDPAPAGGLIALASMQLSSIPKTLPDGSGLEVKMETLEIDGKSTQALHAVLTPSSASEPLFTRMSLEPEAWVFAAGGYVGLVVGADEAAVQKIARHGGGPSPEVITALPKPLAEGLAAERISGALHLSIDGLQSPQTLEAFDQAAKELPAAELPPGLTPEKLMGMVRATTAPVSAISFWMPPPHERTEFHFALSLLGDPRTAEGRAALETMAKVAEGADPGAAYGELVSRYASSDRINAYSTRAGTRSDGALASIALLGVMAAIAVPALTKYSARSKAAAAGLPPAPE